MKKQSKHKGNRKRYASYADRTRRLLSGTDLVIRDGTEENLIIRFAASVPPGKRNSLADYMTSTPNRWHITARVAVRHADGERYHEEVEAETGQALVLWETTEIRDELMRQATASVNPKYVEDRTFIMRIAR